MPTKTLGFHIYKCRTGWAFVRKDVDVVYEPVNRVHAFRSLSQAVFHLAKLVKKIEAHDADVVLRDAGGGADSLSEREETGPKTQPQTTGAGASKDASAS